MSNVLNSLDRLSALPKLRSRRALGQGRRIHPDHFSIVQGGHVDARAGEALLAVHEPLDDRDDEDDEEYNDTVVCSVSVASVRI